MRVAVHNTRDDFVALSEYLAKRSMGNSYELARRVLPLAYFVAALFFLVCAVFFWRALPRPFVVVPVFGSLFSLALSRMWLLPHVLAYYGQKTLRRFGAPFILYVDENGVRIEQRGREHFLDWSQFRHVTRDAHFLFLIRKGLYNSNFGLVIPGRAFASREEAESFSEAALNLWLQSNSSRVPIASP